MKTKKLFVILLSILFSLFLCNCDDNYSTLPEEKTSTPNTWQEELHYAINGKGTALFKRRDLKLINYELIDDSQLSITSIKNETLKNETLVPTYNDSLHINDFELIPISEIKGNNNTILKIYNEKKQQIINSYPEQDFSIVKLLWTYKDKSFSTLCLVSNKQKCVVYDNILSNIRYIIIEEPRVKVSSTPRLKTKSEVTGHVSYKFEYLGYKEYGWSGKVVAKASCWLTVCGTKYDDGSISIDRHTEQADRFAESGYGADAQIQVTSFSEGINGHCEYKYGVAISNQSSISIGWNGSGFSIPSGASQGRSGGGRVIPSMLH